MRRARGSRLPCATATRAGRAGAGRAVVGIGLRLPFSRTWLSWLPSWAAMRVTSSAVLSSGSDWRADKNCD